MSGRHEPVLLRETLGFLRQGPGLYLDATLGEGGHAEALLASEPEARLLGCDRDRDALESSRARLARFGGRVTLAHATFGELPAAHAGAGGEPLAGALFDLGLSSRQIDDPARGMSFRADAPLDLRMDRSRGETAAERLAAIEPSPLAAILAEHGDVPHAARLARAIVAEARRGALETTGSLVRLVERESGGRVAPRRLAQVFQALRIWINDEAEHLERALEWLPGAMRDGGVVVTLAYHSGEDRRIKRMLRQGRPVGSRRRPPQVQVNRTPGPWQELTRKVLTPAADETASNPRARSARLRAFRRIGGEAR